MIEEKPRKTRELLEQLKVGLKEARAILRGEKNAS